jgi:hypothetical protein
MSPRRSETYKGLHTTPTPQSGKKGGRREAHAGSLHCDTICEAQRLGKWDVYLLVEPDDHSNTS